MGPYQSERDEHWESGDIHTEIVLVTPEIAETWIRRNVKNRRIDESLVRVYQASMARGQWMLNGEPIIFGLRSSPDEDDAPLLDGQHRLKAVIKSRATIRTLVVWGVHNEYQANMDIGKKRTVGDALSLSDLKNSADLAAASRLIWRYRRDQWSNANRPTHQELIDIVMGDVDALVDAISVGVGIRGAIGLTSSVGGAGFFITSNISPVDAKEFSTKLIKGVGLEATDPAYILRDRVVRHKASIRERVSSEEWLAYYIKAWNAFRSGVVVKRLTWAYRGKEKEAEPFPRAK